MTEQKTVSVVFGDEGRKEMLSLSDAKFEETMLMFDEFLANSSLNANIVLALPDAFLSDVGHVQHYQARVVARYTAEGDRIMIVTADGYLFGYTDFVREARKARADFENSVL